MAKAVATAPSAPTASMSSSRQLQQSVDVAVAAALPSNPNIAIRIVAEA